MSPFHAKRGQAWHKQRKIVPKHLRTSADGILHDSQQEMTRWNALKLLESRGLVRDLHRQVSFPLQFNADRAVLTPTGRVASYKPDFCYERLILGKWERIIEDVKGFMDPTAQLRIAVFEACYGVKVTIVK